MTETCYSGNADTRDWVHDKGASKKLFSAILAIVLLAAALLLVSGTQLVGQVLPNPSAANPFDAQSLARADELLKQMTLEEKVGQMAQYFYIYPDETLAKEQIQKGAVGSYLFVTDPTTFNRLQKIAVTESRLFGGTTLRCHHSCAWRVTKHVGRGCVPFFP